MTDQKTHWKKLVNPEYIGAYLLNPGEEKILTIKNVVRQDVIGSDGKKEKCTVAHFVEPEKPMILNRTNAKIISKIYDTPYIEEWAGKKIKIYATKVKAFGELVECLRIKLESIVLPTLTKPSAAYDKVVKHIQGGGLIEEVEKRYTVTDDVKKMIMEDSK